MEVRNDQDRKTLADVLVTIRREQVRQAEVLAEVHQGVSELITFINEAGDQIAGLTAGGLGGLLSGVLGRGNGTG